MISQTERQADALTELVNIAFGLTAAKLSEIAGHRVLLEPPIIAIHPMEALAAQLGLFVTDNVATVHQVFTGPVAGDAMLVLEYDSAVKLSNLLAEEGSKSHHFDAYTNEILTEVGNMLLTACLGMFGNLLQVHVTFSMPRLHLESLERFLASISVGGDELRFAVVVTALFNLCEQGVEGRIVIVLDVASLELLIQAVEKWENSQY